MHGRERRHDGHLEHDGRAGGDVDRRRVKVAWPSATMPRQRAAVPFAGHEEPYYPYLDYGQTGWYSDTLRRGTPHQVVVDPPEVPPTDEWTGQERRDSLPRWPQFTPSTKPKVQDHADGSPE